MILFDNNLYKQETFKNFQQLHLKINTFKYHFQQGLSANMPRLLLSLLACCILLWNLHLCKANNTDRLQMQRQKSRSQQQQQQSQNAQTQPQQVEAARASESASTSPTSWLGPELLIVRRVYEDCQDNNDFLGCLKQKALLALSRALEQDSIKIVDGLVLEKQNVTEKESLIGNLADARSFNALAPLDRALLQKVDKLARTHSLKIDMSVGRGDDEGGHHHKKKKEKEGGHMKYVIAAMLTAMGIAGPIGLKALAAIAIKALVISKVALTIAGIIALKKLFSHDGHEETSFQVHAGGEHNRRNTYVIRPAKANGEALAAAASSVDPYRYYYEYH